MSGVTVSRIGERVAALQEADPNTHEAERLLRMADTLGRISHPCVVELLEAQTEPTVRVATGFVSTDSWADRPPHGADVTARLAQLCSAIADLHDAGIAHGSLESRHVLVCGDGRSVICGFGDSGPATPDALAGDLAALAEIADELAAVAPGRCGAALESVSRDLRRGRLSARSATSRLDRLDQRSDAGRSWPATRPGASLRARLRGGVKQGRRAGSPEAARLAELRDAADSSHEMPKQTAPRHPHAGPDAWALRTEPGRARASQPPRRLRAGRVLTGLGVSALAVLALRLLSGGDTPATPAGVSAGSGNGPAMAADPDQAAAQGQHSGSANAAEGAAGVFAGSTSGSAASGSGSIPDLPQAPVAAGTPEVTHDGRLYAVGRPGDQVLLGDWSCDGVETPAVLRPDTSEIAVFGYWPADGSALRPDHVEVVDGAHRLAVDETADCDRLRIHTPDGSRLLRLEEP